MPVDDIFPTHGIKPYSGNPQQGKSGHNSGHKSGYGSYSSNHDYPPVERNVSDITSFMNIPQDELTPAVTDAIISLMEEIDHLRAELSMTHSNEEKLSNAVDRHKDMPVLTRHALCREVMIIATRMRVAESSAVFVYFQISNFPQIKQRYGLLAGENVMRQTATILKSLLRETDRIGTLGGDGFGMVLALSDMDGALKKVEQLEKAVKHGPVLHNGRVIDVEIAYGLHSLHLNEELDVILNAADKDLHKRFVRQ